MFPLKKDFAEKNCQISTGPCVLARPTCSACTVGCCCLPSEGTGCADLRSNVESTFCFQNSPSPLPDTGLCLLHTPTLQINCRLQSLSWSSGKSIVPLGVCGQSWTAMSLRALGSFLLFFISSFLD